ncbi:hypothetical protein [Rickettsia endosymbiont of Orchestes rusci]|uniref:hypothetical protein n=1 Tax=Rickettsia endosymbiont of Orchestes rusci TaxID=3066250 RepID=UPI00313B8275
MQKNTVIARRRCCVDQIFDVIPAQAGIQKKHFYVILNLFQDLLMRCAKLVQHDKKSLDSRLRRNDILPLYRAMQQRRPSQFLKFYLSICNNLYFPYPTIHNIIPMSLLFLTLINSLIMR